MKSYRQFRRQIGLKRNSHPFLVLFLSISMVVLPLEALPTGASVASGTAAINSTVNSMQITTSNKAIINYSSFNIGSNELVNFVQPSSNSVVLNRVVLANPSSILGTLKANGNVFLVNPAGIYFGTNSVVDANSFLATTLNISDTDFLNGNYLFNQMSDTTSSYIINKGSITVSPEGFIVLAAPMVSSEGQVIAKAGHIVIGATDNFYIQFDPQGLMQYDYQKVENSDTPIIIPKEYADTIIENVLNTESIQEAVGIVQNGDKIELVGGSGTAFISGELNTDATAEAQAGIVEVKATSNALILDNAKLQSNALLDGDGGTIDIYAEEFAYGDKGASFVATGGEISGDGGFVELSAKDKVVFGGSYLDLRASNGANGLFLIDPEDLEVIDADFYTNGANVSWEANNKITLNSGITVSTRDVAVGGDHLNDASVGNSGSITMTAPEIELGSGSSLLTFTELNSIYSSGAITLTATSSTTDLGVLALSKISINGATLKGGDITLTATADSQDFFDSDDGTDDAIGYKILDVILEIPFIPIGVSIAKTDASITVGSGSNIDGESVNIQSNANAEASTFTVFSAFAIGYGEALASAVTTVSDGATITASGNIDIGSDAIAINSVKAYSIGLGGGRGSTVDVSLAYTKTDTISTTTIENGAYIETAGDLTINAHASKNINSTASAAAYADGSVGAALAISRSSSITSANVGGEIYADNLLVQATTDNELIKTSSAGTVGSGFVAKRILSGVNSAISGIESLFNASANSQSGSTTTKLAASAALSYAEHSSDTTASISDSSAIDVSGDVSVEALTTYSTDEQEGTKGVKSSAAATISSNTIASKTYAVAGAVVITKLTTDTNAYIGNSATVDAGGDIDVIAKTSMPYEITWHQIDSASDITDKMNPNLGIQNGFFTTWAQSQASGDKVGVAGGVNFFEMINSTNAYIDQSAQINQNINSYGMVRLLALTDLQTMNISGVYGSGTAGVGGSYLDISYDDTTTATIYDNAYIDASALAVIADSKTKNISITVAGGNADKYGVAGSFAYLQVNDNTYAKVQSAHINTLNVSDNRDYNNDDNAYTDGLDRNFIVYAKDNSQLLNISGGVVKAQNIGIGVSVSLSDITRDTSAIIDATTFNGDGDAYVEAINDGDIGAWSLAGVINTPLTTTPPTGQEAPSGGGSFGIGISGDVSLNNISDTTKASVENSTIDNNSNLLSVKAQNDSEINSYSGSVALSLSASTSVGLAGSYSQNSLENITEALISNSDITAGDLIINATNTGLIDAYSASGSLQPGGVGVAGSVSINEINSDITAYLNFNSEIDATGNIEVSSSDEATINTIAGSASFGGKAGIGSSFAKDDISNSVESEIKDSQLIATGAIDVTAIQTSVINSVAASLGASTGNLAAAVAITINTITNTIKAYIDGTYGNGIDAGSDISILATDDSEITSRSGEISGSGTAGFGASVLYNTITNTIEAYAQNTHIEGDDNIYIQAISDKTITSQSAGGTGAGTVAAAGGVLINTIKDNTKAYIFNSNVNTPNSISVKASETNRIDTFGGTLSGAGTLGIGGTVTVNTIENNIDAYVKDSTIEAGGNDEINVPKDDETIDTQMIRGLDVLAIASETLDVKVANISGGGTAAIGASVSVDKITDTINSYIDNSNVNEVNSNPNIDQSVRVRAVNKDDVNVLAGGLAIGGTVGANGSSDTTLITTLSQAYITGSLIDARKLVEVKDIGFTRINSQVVSGAGSGTVSVAGNVAVVNVDNSNHAFVYDSDIFSDDDLLVLAADTTNLGIKKDGSRTGILAGSTALAGGVGVGGAVVVTKTKQNVLAHVDNSRLNAKGTTTINSDAYADVVTHAATLAGGLYVGAGGAVTVNTIEVVSKAYTFKDAAQTMLINQDNNYKNSTQDVTIEGSSYSVLTSDPGAVGAGFVGASGSVDVATIRSTVLGEVGGGTQLYTGRSLLVKAVSDKRIYSNVVAFGAGAVGVSGAVSIANINSGIDDDGLNASENTKTSTNDIVGNSSVGTQLGDTQTANNTKTELDNETDTLSVSSEFEQTQPEQTTYARIGVSSIIESGYKTSVKTSDFFDVDQLSGAAAGGVAGIGGAVTIANIGSNNRAYISTGVTLNTHLLEVISNLETLDSIVESYAAAAGAVGLGAAVSLYDLEYINSAYIDDGSSLTLSGDMLVDASTDLTSSSKAYGTAVGGGALGLTKSELTQSGTTQSFLGEGVTIRQSAGDIDVLANYITDIETYSLAGAAGIGLAASGSLSDISATPTILAVVGNGVDLQSTGAVTIGASASGSLWSQADGVSIGSVAVGVSKATASWNSTIKSMLGSYGTMNLNSFNMYSYENVDSSGNFIYNNVKAKAFSAVGSLYGGSGSLTEATSDSEVQTSIGLANDITATNAIDIKSKSYSKSDAESDGFTFALYAAGFTGSKSTNNAVVSTTVGADSSLSSENAINISSYSKHTAYADSRGGAGGLLSGAGTKATVNMDNDVDILIDDRASLLVNNGDINIWALANLYSESVSSITTAGGITVNESEANTVINQDVDVVIGSNTYLEAQNIDILAKVERLNAKSEAYSKTIAANSWSHAYSNMDVTSDVTLHIENSATLKATELLRLRAIQSGVYAESTARARIDAGVTGSLDVQVHNDMTLTSNVYVDSLVSLTAKEIYMEATSPKTNEMYVQNADAEANTIVNWILTAVDKLVKSWYDICCLGWFFEWVWTTVMEWVREVLNSEIEETISGSFASTGTIVMDGDIHQISSLPQELVIDSTGTISSSGDITAQIVGDDIVMDDLINHDIGKITLKSSGEVRGSGNIYFSNAYPDVTITNHTDKNLQINDIDTISDNADEANIEVYAQTNDTNDETGGNHTNFNYFSELAEHTVDIQNLGSGDVVFNGVVDNYAGDMSVYNTYGSILAETDSLIKTSTLSLSTLQGNIGSATNRVEIELQKNASDTPFITSSSLGSAYLGIKLSESLNNEPSSNYVVESANINHIQSNGLVDIALRTANVYWDDGETIETIQRASKFSINNIDARDDIVISGETGVSLSFDGTMKSGYKDLLVDVDGSDPSLTTSEYVDSITTTDINIKPISQTGGSIAISLADGDFTNSGVATILDGYMHMNIQNSTDKNLNLSSIDLNDRVNGSFTSNGVLLSFTPTGYGTGQVDVLNSGSGELSMLGDILNPTGAVAISGNNGIFNPSDSYILGDTISLTTTLNSIGTLANRVRVDGALSSTSSDDVFIYGSSGLLIDEIIATGATVYLDSADAISDTDANDQTINIQAQNLELTAVNNIGVSSSNAIKLNVQNIAANSQNGAIYLKNSSDATVTTVGTTTGLHAVNDINYEGMGSLTQVVGAGITSDSATVKLTTVGNMRIDNIVAPQSVTLSSTSGHITQDGDAQADVTTNDLILYAANGIGDNGVTEDAIDTDVVRLDAKNITANNINIANLGNLEIVDMSGDGYALYNSGGSINISSAGSLIDVQDNILVNGNFELSNIETAGANDDITIRAGIYSQNGFIRLDSGDSVLLDSTSNLTTGVGDIIITAGANDSDNIGAFTQNTGSTINSGNNLIISAIENITLASIGSGGDISIHTQTGNILSNNNINAQGNIHLETSESGTADDITIKAGIYSNNGFIRLDAADSITLGSLSDIETASGNIFMTAGNLDSDNIGAFTQLTGSRISSGNNIEISAIGDILLSYMQSIGGISIYTRDGNILGDESILLNLNVGSELNMLADSGAIGAPGNSISITEGNGGTFVQANGSKDLISVFIKGIDQPLDSNTNPDLSVFENRPISGTLIDRYLDILYNGSKTLYDGLQIEFKNIDEFKEPEDLVDLSLNN